MQNYSKFSALLRKYNSDPKRLSEALSVSRGVISHWSLGKRTPSDEHITAISAALGCDVNEVIRCFRKKYLVSLPK